jgi:NADH:ubiquinone oxidoreductase subunit 4 (subunit M)
MKDSELDINSREFLMHSVLAVAVLYMGIYPTVYRSDEHVWLTC